jgi:hypothetical protein
MLDQTFAGLCGRMQGKSITRGWDAICTMNRTKVNSLLEQQYIARFNKGAFLEKISGEHSMSSDPYSVLELKGLILSAPKLSFINATLANSRARLTMVVEAGTVNQRLDIPNYPTRVTSSYRVTPQQGFSVDMDIDLLAAPGTVEEGGKVIINLANAYNFTSNLVEGAIAQEALGQIFQEWFDDLPPEQQIYELGVLNFNADDHLVPREFEIRTQKAPGGADPRSASFQDGAVVLFIRTRNNPTNGSTPVDESNFDYYIPGDLDPDTGEAIYSGSLILSSRSLFDWFIEPHLMNMIGGNLRLGRESPSNEVARSLRAIGGGFTLPDFENKHTWEGGLTRIYTSVKNDRAFTIPFSNSQSDSALRFSANTDNVFQCTWVGDQPINLWFEDRYIFGVGDESYGYRGYAKPVLSLKLKPVVNTSDDTVSFERIDYSYRFSGQWVPPNYNIGLTPRWIFDRVGDMLSTEVQKHMEPFKTMSLPGINVFHLNHLLFPEENALLLTEAALPGDLFLVGHIDPKKTAFTLEPLFGRVKTGDTLKFNVKQLALRSADITWSVRGIDGTRVSGEISDDGTFTAPDAGLLDDLAVRNVVTASYRDVDTGEVREASALVVVVVEPMTLTPSMLTIDVQDAAPVTLRATVLKDEPLKWTLRGLGSLDHTGYDATYTPPSTIGEPLLPIEIEVEGLDSGDKVTASIILLNGIFVLPVEPGFHPGLPAQGMAQLRVDDEDFDPAKIRWSVVAGQGHVDSETGEFTAPAQIHSPYTVVQATYGTGVLAKKGYSIIHLSDFARTPRWRTLDFFRLVSDSLTTRVLSNGMQQVNVVVEVRPHKVGGVEVDVSDAELASIRLVTKNHVRLKQVGKDGVPPEPTDPGTAWDPWGSNNTKNEFLQYSVQQHEAETALPSRNPNGRARTFYVQTRANTKLEIAAFMLGDNGLPYYSNEDGGSVIDKRLIEITPVPAPEFANSAYKLTPKRVAGLPENDDDLSTIDYYLLELNHNNRLVRFKTIEFPANKSIVQWESRQFDEDVCSFTGYALEKSSELNFDERLYQRMPDVPAPGEGEVDKRVRPSKTVIPGEECPEGRLLISLHRSQYWYFDQGAEPDYTGGMRLNIFDVHGNRHSVMISFRTPTDRNTLIAEKG